MKKRVFVVLLSLVFVFGLVACGSPSASESTGSVEASESAEVSESTEASESAEVSESAEASSADAGGTAKSAEDMVIGVVLRSSGSEFWGYTFTGAEDAARDIGCTVDIIAPQSETSYDEQNSQIENYISSGRYDALVIAPLSDESIDTVIGDPEVPVVLLISNADFPARRTTVNADNHAAAYSGAQYALEQLGDDIGNVVVIGGLSSDANGLRRQAGFEKALEDAGITPAAVQHADWLADKATSTMENILTELNNEVSLVLCCNDEMASGVAKALAQAGVDDAYIVGFDGIQSGVENVINGKVDITVAQQPYLIGYQGVELAVKAALGEEINGTTDIPTIIITSENAEEYMEELKAISAN